MSTSFTFGMNANQSNTNAGGMFASPGFGNAQGNTANSIFGAGGASLFGSNSSNQNSPFGSNNLSNNQSGSLFNSSASNINGATFGSNSTTNQSGSIFGNTNTGFGNSGVNQAATLFGKPGNTQTTSSGMFGTSFNSPLNVNQNSGFSGTTMFSGNSSNASAAGGFNFGSSNNTTSLSSNMFNKTNNTQNAFGSSSFSGFNQQNSVAPTSTSFAFNSTNQLQPSTGQLFSPNNSITNQNLNQPARTTNLFGVTNNAFGSTVNNNSFMSNPQTSTVAQSSFNFGAGGMSSTSGGFGFGTSVNNNLATNPTNFTLSSPATAFNFGSSSIPNSGFSNPSAASSSATGFVSAATTGGVSTGFGFGASSNFSNMNANAFSTAVAQNQSGFSFGSASSTVTMPNFGLMKSSANNSGFPLTGTVASSNTLGSFGSNSNLSNAAPIGFGSTMSSNTAPPFGVGIASTSNNPSIGSTTGLPNNSLFGTPSTNPSPFISNFNSFLSNSTSSNKISTTCQPFGSLSSATSAISTTGVLGFGSSNLSQTVTPSFSISNPITTSSIFSSSVPVQTAIGGFQLNSATSTTNGTYTIKEAVLLGNSIPSTITGVAPSMITSVSTAPFQLSSLCSSSSLATTNMTGIASTFGIKTTASISSFNNTTASVGILLSTMTTSSPIIAATSTAIQTSLFSQSKSSTSLSSTMSTTSAITSFGITTCISSVSTSAVSGVAPIKGLGGSPSLPKNNKELDHKESVRQVKDLELDYPVRETVEEFKKFVSEQYEIREYIIKSNEILSLLGLVSEDSQTLRQSINEVSNGLQKLLIQSSKLKHDIDKEQVNIKIAQRAPPDNSMLSSVNSSGHSESSVYFAKKAREFENRTMFYMQEIQSIESIVKSSNKSPLNSKDLVDIIRKIDDDFIGLAAKLYMVHERIRTVKAEHIRKLRQTGNTTENPFKSVEGRFGDTTDSVRSTVDSFHYGRLNTNINNSLKIIRDTVGSSPFDNSYCMNQANCVMPVQTGVVGSFQKQSLSFGGGNSNVFSGLGSNNNSNTTMMPFGSQLTQSSGVSSGFGSVNSAAQFGFNKPTSLFGNDSVSNKKRR